ncbi:hypothetical protein TCAP_03373 [Tolypocladium capitatum]|uniref:Uncharacterized protein n=1 Tax=Tolypocladium capitatum TaxID=45235 RepID=A0A2K3QGQ6_9HYPO|nr:hypothetical protein TCAP_03373 [Tolypocladium capitatum]
MASSRHRAAVGLAATSNLGCHSAATTSSRPIRNPRPRESVSDAWSEALDTGTLRRIYPCASTRGASQGASRGGFWWWYGVAACP